jgi:uncharacterized protein (TIGR00369 family)
MAETLDIRFVEVEPGRAVVEATIGERVYNSYGTAHGGFAATMLDYACAYAAVSRLEARQTVTTVDLKIAYHRPMTAETGVVRAEGRVITIGRRVAFAEGKLTDESGRIYVSATATMLVA